MERREAAVVVERVGGGELSATMTVGKTEEACEYDRELCDGLMGKTEMEEGGDGIADGHEMCKWEKTRDGNQKKERNEISHCGEVRKKG